MFVINVKNYGVNLYLQIFSFIDLKKNRRIIHQKYTYHFTTTDHPSEIYISCYYYWSSIRNIHIMLLLLIIHQKYTYHVTTTAFYKLFCNTHNGMQEKKHKKQSKNSNIKMQTNEHYVQIHVQYSVFWVYPRLCIYNVKHNVTSRVLLVQTLLSFPVNMRSSPILIGFALFNV